MENSEIDKKIQYIYDHINELKINYRKEILQMLIYSNINENKIVEKGNGTQIKFSDIPKNIITNIYNYIHIKMENSGDIFC